MRPYPMLSEEAYNDPTKVKFNEEVVDRMAVAAADVYHHYKAQVVSESQRNSLRQAIAAVIHTDVSWFPLRIREVDSGREYVVETPAEIPSGVAFVVLKTKVS